MAMMPSTKTLRQMLEMQEQLERVERKNELDADAASVLLQQRFQTFMAQNTFVPGDLVTFKPGMKNRRWPDEGYPAVVIATRYSDPYFDMSESGSPMYGEPLDLALGSITPEGEFGVWWYDSRRFQPWK